MTTMRRVLAALAALALAAFGAVVLISYVRGADARAEAGAVLVPVLVVDQDVPAGTPAAELADLVRTAEVPSRLVVPGSVEDLADVAGLTTTTSLVSGEQVVFARFADPSVQAAAAGVVELPTGTEEVSLTLEPQRAVGGALVAGDRIGVFISQGDPTTTDLAVGEVLVTRVAGGADDQTAALTGAAQTVTVTLALTPEDAAVVIAGMEQGAVWLSLQESVDPADTSLDSTTTTTGADQ
ncbi:RcpC/CpaB family pilus assembly protein [Modestobacter sp. VKM Ac-2979]|uniref:Flp pilus assembly protein CpaB n=1 Tax=unclassified Modestobacter TaxID=2643866 RepID=UPI0022AB6739|nr:MULTISPECIES: RcpC/CpaB family pilus assembly protein [unclassified Modestobacter]MCZ2810082.1 RcpC/CpaB family pilus assembly protein [Modestobacter sp. VKM Ac-2979]